ncbi:PilN domain-containing protein [Microcoleus sp. FACHB-831]|uniref:PilN domain-containing protein n=1 Tax=Microcoleus sp. FACHB-831 TaxID=2692827 RepID=UPI001686B115|nr:PilN domain-containing protein [Microcoleus sp. FACHB-831]MBD1921569.1 PilN domain-containing protein [Microcoleus sp. FACHB-831]
MYSLDVNFLKDRPDFVNERSNKPKKEKTPIGTMVPLIAGVAVGLLLPGAVGGLLWYLNQQTAQLEQEGSQLDTQLASQTQKQNEIKSITQQTTTIQGETQALASVFNQIKPWSAMLQEVRDRIPPGVQIKTIVQTEQAAPAPAATPAPNAQAQTTPLPIANLEISGTARSFNDVNDFLLTLQRSSFLKKDSTQLVSASLVANPTTLELPKTQAQAANVKIELPKVVEYKIQTSLTDVPSSELVRELDRKGAVGIVSRIRNLQTKGVIQP